MIPSIYLNNSKTRGPIVIYSLILFSVGLLAGMLLQKYYPVGKLVQATGITYRAAPTPTPMLVSPERIEVPISMLPSQHVMVALVFGQSNSANFGETPRKAKEGIYNFHHGKLYIAQDPLLGADGNGGSVWTRLGDKIMAEDLYDAVVFVPLGVGSTQIARWKSDGDLHLRILEAIDELKTQQLPITHLLWHQGEQDAILKTSKEEYKKMFLDMLSSIRNQGVNAPIYVSISTRCGKEWDREIQQAQGELVDRSKRIYTGPNTDLLGSAYRYDGCHFSDEGLEQAATLWLQALKLSLARSS
jgi:Carbohydrate esterase, sialic acid-specific acetylesterase